MLILSATFFMDFRDFTEGDVKNKDQDLQPTESDMAAITRFELVLQVLGNTFDQWVKRCGANSDLASFSSTEISILHRIGRSETPRRIADLCFALKIEDTHIVTYAVKKLMKAGLVTSSRTGKDTYFQVTVEGEARIIRYAATKRANLGAALAMFNEQDLDLSRLEEKLQVLAAVYEQAARRAELQE